jgi:PcfJ-like protein
MACQPRSSPVAHARELETQIRRFPRGYRRRLRKLARGSSRLGEVLYTFPGLAFVLAAGGCPPAARGQAIRLVKDGQRLPEAAAALGLPLWMRRLPPEAFTEALGTLPASEEFGRRVVNGIPNNAQATAMWLRWVLSGAEFCDESFSLWLAKQSIYQADDAGRMPLLPLAAFAWFSRTAGGPAHGLIVRPWHANMHFGTAVEETRYWLERVILNYCHDAGPRDESWFKTRKVCGYRIMPLLTPDDLREEGDRMNNCVATYIPRVAGGACLIYSIRRGGQRVATMEVAPRQGAPVIVQLLAAGNTNASEDVWRAANGWLAKQGEYPAAGRNTIAQIPVIPCRWEAIWRPYWEARPSFKACLAVPSMRTLLNLRHDMNALARLAKSQ